MSNVIDNKVVEMRFDNAQFESATKQSMSTLDKLKNALKIDKSAGASFDNISKAAKNVNLSGLDSGVQTLQARFSALQVVGVTALANITNSAIQAGKNIVSSFTIDPITDGLREYELQLNSVQTILANTQSKGTTIDQVNGALNELNKYADLTIYNFSEMTRNIGTFTAAGVDLETAVSSIKGIANLAAVSGSSSVQASTAMYQLSQAIAAGKVQLMDWNSVVNAGMGGELFQNALKRTAEHFGTNVDAMIKKYGSFRESLTSGEWLTTEVLTETLSQLSGAYTEADLIAQGYSESQAKEITAMADTAHKAATKVKTFTQLMDTLKEAVGSGWAQTWQLIFGDFEEAKEFFTRLSDHFSDIINSISDARNEFLGEALSSPFEKFSSQITDAGVSMDDFKAKLIEVGDESGIAVGQLIEDQGSLAKAFTSGQISTDLVIETLKRLSNASVQTGESTEDLNSKLEYFQDVVDRVWNGDFKNAPDRYQLLADAGYDYKKVQDLVNKTVDGHRLTLEDLGEEQLKSVGYTEEEIAKINELASAAEKAGTPLNDLINSLQKKSGRDLLLDSVWNIITAIETPLKAVSKAWKEVFKFDSSDLYKLIEGFNKFTKSLIMNETDAKNLKKTLKGLFSILHIVATLAGNAFTMAFKAADVILGIFGTNVLEVTGYIGDIVYQFDQFITSSDGISSVVSGIGDAFSWATPYVVDFFAGFAEYPIVKAATGVLEPFFGGIIDYIKKLTKLSPGEAIKKIFNDVKTAFLNAKKTLSSITWDDVLNSLSEFGEKVREVFKDVSKTMEEIGPNIIEGLTNGLSDNVKMVIDWMTGIGTKLIEAIKAVLGIHSPSTVMYEVGKNICQGLINGITDFLGGIYDAFSGVGEGIKNVLGEIDWAGVGVSLIAVGAIADLWKFADALQGFSKAAQTAVSPIKMFTDVGKSLTGMVDAITGRLEGSNSKFLNISNGIKQMAIAFAILSFSIALLASIKTENLVKGVAVIAALAVIMGILAIAIGKFSGPGSNVDTFKLNTMFISLAVTFGLMAIALAIVSAIPMEGIGKASALIIAFGSITAILIGVSYVAGDKLDGVSAMVTKVASAFILVSIAAKIISSMSWEDLGKAGAGLVAFGVVIGLLIAVTKFAGEQIDGAANFVSKIATAFLLLSVATKIIGSMSWESLGKAGAGLLAFLIIISLLIAATELAGEKEMAEIGATLLAMAGAIAILAIVVKIIAGTPFGDMVKGIVGVALLGAMIAGLVAATRLAGKEQMAKVATTLLAMALSIAILAGIATLLGMVKTEVLVRGIAAIAALSIIVNGLTAVTHFGKSIDQGTFVGIAIVIGILAAALIALSFVEPGKLIAPVIALGTVMVALSKVFSQVGNMKDVKVRQMAIMIGAIVAITASLVILSAMPWQSLLAAAVSMSAVLLALAGACKILGTTGDISNNTLKSVAILGAIVVAIGFAMSLMKEMDPVSAIANAVAMSTVLLAISAACTILDGVGAISTNTLIAVAALGAIIVGIGFAMSLMKEMNPLSAIANAVAMSTVLLAMSAACVILSGIQSISASSLGAMAVLTLVVGGIGIILSMMGDLDPDSSIANAVALSTVLLALAGVTAILAAIGPSASGALSGATAMAGVIGVIAAVVAAAGAIKQIPGAEWLVSEGGSFLQKIGEAIGQFVGGIVGGALEGLTSTLPQVASNLSTFMMNLMPFIIGVKMVDPSIVDSVSALVNCILGLTAANFISGLASFFGLGDFSGLADKFTQLGTALTAFSSSTSGVNAASALLAATALKTVIEAMSQIPSTGGLLDGLFGTKDYSGFANGMKQLGLALGMFAASIMMVPDMGIVQTGSDALSTMITTMSQIPNSGGLLGAILGGQDYSGFGNGMEQLGTGLKNFVDQIIIIGDNIGLVQTGADALSTMITTMSQIPETGGLLGAILGGQDYTNFGNGMEQLGTGLKNFVDKIIKIGDNMGLVQTGSEALSTMITTMKDIPESGGLWGAIAGGNTDYSGFANGIKFIADGLVEFTKKLKDVNLGTINSAVLSIQRISDMLSTMSGLDKSGAVQFKAALKELATSGIDDFVAEFENGGDRVREAAQTLLDSIPTSFEGIAESMSIVAVNAGRNLASGLANGLSDGITSMSSAILSSVTALCTDIFNLGGSFNDAGVELSSNLAEGTKTDADAISSNLKGPVESALVTIDSYYESFKSAGKYLCQGFANGITANSYMVRARASAMASAAATAARSALDINSPSKVFRKIGYSIPEGLAQGIDRMSKMVDGSSRAMADKAVAGTNAAIKRLSQVSFADIDETITIRPVLDLSGVEDGASAVGSMFSNMAPISLLGEVGAINRSMYRTVQNGTIDEVVSELNKLRKDISKISGDVYNVNGVTYDDGSNVALAVNDLIREIRIERRK